MNSHPSALRDFTVDRRVWLLCSIALIIGAGGAILAVLLLKCIALATNIFYFHRLSLASVRPADSPLGHWMPFVPILGGLIVGVMARYGSDKIRGHGIPEAIEAILLNGARVDPKIAILKPISAAISIGSGGPFGAEGPIIMTGGAFGSLIAQWFHLTDAERTTLLVAGAAAGMSATFASPLAAILLAVELLLFEWRPRSLIPVATASITAAILRVIWLGPGPIFPMPASATTQSISTLVNAQTAVIALALGLLIGLLAWGLSDIMYGFEDLFARLPIHWMWWPAIGGVGIGIGGLFFPRGLGVGYDNIAELLRGNAPLNLLLGLLLAKSLMWAFSLGSGTSGGVLAPLLMIGGAFGELAAHLLHLPAQPLWALVGMGAMLSGSLGVPLTAILFSLEITHSLPAIMPLTIGCIAAYTITSLIMPRSILTEKLARRGYHLTREYGTDPLETVSVLEIMTPTEIRPPTPSHQMNYGQINHRQIDHRQTKHCHLTPNGQGEYCHPSAKPEDLLLPDLNQLPSIYAYTDETSRAAAEKMAAAGLSTLAVVDRETQTLRGTITLADLLQGRRRSIQREQNRQRVFSTIR